MGPYLKTREGEPRTCTVCDETYLTGSYAKHIRDLTSVHRHVLRDRYDAASRARRTGPIPAKVERNERLVAAVVGPPRRTLESVAVQFGLSRERVSQLMDAAGIPVKSLPPLPPKPPAPRKRHKHLCTVCGEQYMEGQYAAHLRASGHPYNRQADPATTARVIAAIKAGGRTWDEIAEAEGVSKASVATFMHRTGEWRRGWQPHHRDRNRDIVRRYCAGEQAKDLAAAYGISRSHLHHIVRGAQQGADKGA